MRWCVNVVLLLGVLCGWFGLSSQELSPVLRASGVAAADKTGCYVVVLKKESNSSTFENVKSTLLELSKDSHLYGSVQNVVKAITITLNDSSLEMVRSIADIEYIEEETIAHGVQQVPWHLDRIDQQELPLNNQYLPIAAGSSVDLYVLDSGIDFAHEEFENRAKYSGYDPTDVYEQDIREGTDCHGHGTHVASLAAGKTYGVAKSVRVYSVRVLNCENRGAWSVVLSGLDHVSRVAAERGRPAIVSLSLGGSYFRTVNDAIQELYVEGIFSASAAGNDFGDACENSPASSSYTFTVAGSSSDDSIYFATNYGQCVDIFAPGDAVRGADYACSTCSQVLSGTSMATPIVSGVAAILLSMEPLLKPQALMDKLTASAVENTLSFSGIPFSSRSLTTNRLLHVPGECGGVFEVPVLIQSPEYPQGYPHNLMAAPCLWTVMSSPGDGVVCNFMDFETEANYDVVTVCDGQYCCPTSVLAVLSGSPSSVPYISIANSLTLQLTSDGIINRRGFIVSCESSGSSPIPPIVSPPTMSPITPPTTTPTTEIDITAPPPIVSPTLINETCNQNELDRQVPLILSDILEETSIVLQDLVTDSLNGVLRSKIVGRLVDYPAASCRDLAAANLLASGFYWVRAANGSSVQVYCDLHTDFRVGARGFMQVANFNATMLPHECPPPLQVVEGSCGRVLCGRGLSSPGCSSVYYSTFGVPYSMVCGRVIGYQFSTPNAFFAHQYDSTISIDEAYLDGVSISYGSSPRQHIWSFAAGISRSVTGTSICPCSSPRPNTLSVPPFVKQNYFCESGNHALLPEDGKLFCEDPLWDGLGCDEGNSCCDHGAWFCADLEGTVTEDIELRLCGNENVLNEDTPLESIHIYIQ